MNLKHVASVALLCMGLGTAAAQTPVAAQTTPAPESLEQTLRDLKQPVSWLSWGADFRVRNEYFNNLLTLDSSANLHEQDYFRFRTRLWTAVAPVQDLTLNVRLTTEPREWMKPAGYSPYVGQSGLDWTEGVFDALNVRWTNVLAQPLVITVGRQDILLGDGWLTGEGTPYDGSWTFYMDAARLTYEMVDQHTTVEAIGICQQAKDDAWMPTINNQNRYETDQNERGAILNVINRSIAAANINPYFIYKHDEKVADPKAPATGDNADIYTLGSRIFGNLDQHWKYSVEGAYQFGEKQDLFVLYPTPSTEFRDISAWGLNTRLTYQFKDSLNNQLTLSYEQLSGDDPSTASDEMFDNLWGRFPFWGETGLYAYARETRVGQQANLQRVGPTWAFNPAVPLEFSASYYALFAPEEVPTRGRPGAFTNSGNFRGHYLLAVLKYKFGPHVSGHLQGEVLFPGDYYVLSQPMSFVRAELLLTF